MKLGIGTAQFGLDYGISNQEGKTPPAEVARILDIAAHSGVRVIDTASLYGTSEQVLGKTMPPGHHFDIVTKTPHFSKYSIPSEEVNYLEETFHQSLLNLDQSSVYGLLVHRADDLLVENGHLLMAKMLDLKQQGLVSKVGVSIYNSEQIERLLDKYSIDLVQLPINVLDQRFILGGYLSMLKTKGIEIHARSVFLQGLLLMQPDSLPNYFDSVKAHLRAYHDVIARQDISPIEAALAFVNDIDEIDVVLCGINNCQQLQQVLLAMDTPYGKGSRELANFAITNTSILNPSAWGF
ncbi:MAG: aldo/keto reductase [Coleofasciculus chthonoplastes F3-SA18-01]|uniref:aldo/keto reductase n=1 Tax=Coleofasciculus chthonoplastes TaxID=64178 RepID=UPI0033012C7F